MLNAGNRVLVTLVVVLSALAGTQAFLLARLVPSVPAAPVGSFAPMLEQVIPAVVTIRVTGETLKSVEIKQRQDNLKFVLLATPEKEPFRAGGSGVVIDAAKGYILTNNHVIEYATRIEVGLSDGRRMLAVLVGRDIGSDLAVLKVEAKALPSIILGDSDAVRVGDVVAAVGNPFGLEGTATLGIVGAVMRTDIGHEVFEDFLQIDAQTNPGNSGGALVNVKGELVGINTVVSGGKGSNSFTIGFAVPINMAKIIQTELIAHGRMQRGSPGLIVVDQDLVPAMSEASSVTPGAVVTEVVQGSSAAASEIKPGDLVIQAANKPVRSAAEYMMRVSTVPAGAAIPLVIYSDGILRKISLTVSSIAIKPIEKRLQPQSGAGIAGAIVGDILPGNPLYGDLRGAQILEMPERAPDYASGLAVGDVIVAIDSAAVRTTDDLLRRIEQAALQYRVDIIRNGIPAWVRVTK